MRRLLLPVAISFLVLACSAGGDNSTPRGDHPLEPGKPVNPGRPAEQKEELERLSAALAAAQALTTDDFLAAHRVPFAEGLPYRPGEAGHLPLIQASPLALDADELARLDERGFVISERQSFANVAQGLEVIYAADLPVYVSADAILEAVHRSYDDILKAVEEYALHGELKTLLEGMRANLAAGGAAELGEQARRDADLYLAVALGLLLGEEAPPMAGADAGEIAALRSGAAAHAGGWQRVTLFGVDRDVDFSQFTPRGHYTDSELLRRYFQATMWLGRIDFRLLETQPDGSQVFHRRQLEGALALRALLDPATRGAWERIDRTIAVFVGEPDNMTLPQLDLLLADLGVDVAGLAAVPDADIARAIVAGGYGTQRISSHIMVNGIGAATLPLSSTFLLLGQRYVIDSHVFSNLVYDRVRGGAAKRMMPDPLDAAFAALGNDQAAALLEPELRQWEYAPDLEAMRILADAHPAEFWESSLYNLWLRALRNLSPDPAEIADPTSGLPAVARTEAWGRRIAGTQLASWAELRHDTILYAKQSYTGGVTCQFPDAYVDPYPEFYDALQAYAERGRGLVHTLATAVHLAPRLDAYFTELSQVAERLADMARRQRRGEPFTAEQLAWVNEAVRIQWGCGDPAGVEGWYGRLHFASDRAAEYAPTIADVHTQPTDEYGNRVGRVLHVGTGKARLLVVTAETCVGPRAYVGVASSYFEEITEGFERLDDPAWEARLRTATPADVDWLQDLVVR